MRLEYHHLTVKKIIVLGLFLITGIIGCHAQKYTALTLPDSISSGKQGAFHVQGVAVDKTHGYVYFSYTDKLIKMDLSGHLIGSVTGLVGHLGDLAFDAETGKIYGSLEFKDDAIGKGISKKLGSKNSNNINFYIAIFDGSKIVKPGMDADKGNILRTAWLREVVADYKAEVKTGARTIDHRFGCSGIDGITIGPAIGKTDSQKKYVYIAYGIYGDTTRNDNDHQIILQYDIAALDKPAQRLSQDSPHHSGPKQPLAKYFVKTGNTTYGIQNLAFDDATGNFFAAVYPGTKPQFPNYTLFVIDGHKAPVDTSVISGDKKIQVKMLSLLDAGPKDTKTGIRGWYFPWGSTGLFPLGRGFFYISHNKKTKDDRQTTTLHKYKWIGNEKEAFTLVR